jgi:PBSX family phage terminase large subunit
MKYSLFSEKQIKTMYWWRMPKYEKYDAIICDGSIRSGKTLSMAVGFVLWSMSEFDGNSFAICGKTVESLRRNVIVPMQKWLEGLVSFKERVKQNYIDITAHGKTNRYYMFGGKDESSYALIQGMTLSGVLFDEVALMPRSFVDQALARCSVDGARFWFNCNPDSPRHWFYTEWLKKTEDKNAMHLRFTMDDNLSLSDKKREQYERLYSGVFRSRYILGEWVKAEGVIYKLFVENMESFLVDTCNETLSYITIGIDYGASRSCTTFKATGFTAGFKMVYSLAESDSDGVSEPEEIYRRFEKFYLSVVERWGKCYYVFADYGALGQILTNGLMLYMQRRGYPVQIQDCTKGKIVERILLVSQLMAQGRYKILRSCPRLINAFRDAVWDEKHDDERLDNGTSDIDSLDAFEYSVFPFSDKLI